jgi:hypothetical protein
MLGSEILEVAIGLIFLFFMLSLLLSAAREVLEGRLQTRAIHLERGIREMLKDETGTGLVKQLYGHPIINSLYRGKYDPGNLTERIFKGIDEWKRMPFSNNLPAYIPARNFALALFDIAGRGEPGLAQSDRILTFDAVKDGLSVQIADPHIRRAILMAMDSAKGDLDQARINLEAWFDSSMDRVSGWYRKETQRILLVMGLITAIVLNIDSLHVAQVLYNNDALRSAIVADAEAFNTQAKLGGVKNDNQAAMLKILGCGPEAKQLAPGPAGEARSVVVAGDAKSDPGANVSCTERRIRELGFPIGWDKNPVASPFEPEQTLIGWIASLPWRSIPGWILTALAVSFGAPFWFDLLNKIMVVRSTVKPHEKSPEEASEDRQSPARKSQVQPPMSPAAPASPATVAPATGTVSPVPAAPSGSQRREADDDDSGWNDKIDPMEGQ